MSDSFSAACFSLSLHLSLCVSMFDDLELSEIINGNRVSIWINLETLAGVLMIFG